MENKDLMKGLANSTIETKVGGNDENEIVQNVLVIELINMRRKWDTRLICIQN